MTVPSETLVSPRREYRAWVGLAVAVVLVALIVSANRWRSLHETQEDEATRMNGAGRSLQKVLALQLEAAQRSMHRASAPEPHALELALDPASLVPLLRTALYADDMQVWLQSGDGRLLAHSADARGATSPPPASTHLSWAGDLTTEGMAQPLHLVLARERAAVLDGWRERNVVALVFWTIAFVVAATAIRVLQRRNLSEARRSHAHEERLALALRGGDLGLWDLDLASGRMLVDARANQMLGLGTEPSTIAFDAWGAQVHPQDWPAVQAAHDAHLQGRSEQRKLIYRMREAGGRWLWVLDRGKVLQHAADGRPLRMLGTRMDISARMQTEEALRARERELSALTDAWPGPAWHADPSGRCLFANAAFGLWFGPPAASGSLLSEAIGADLPLALAGQTVQAERQLTTVDGRARRVLMTLVPDRTDAAAVQGYFAVLLDITELRHAELRREELEGQLREAQKMEAIGTLAGGIAHDFNNIMAAILGQCSLAADALPPDHAAQPMLRAVHQAGLRGRSLVRQILSFSRREAGPQVPLPLAPLVDETLAMLHAMLPAAVTIDRCGSDEPVPVQGDATQIQQVLVNLVTNAWHALPAGGGRIEVGFERVPSSQVGAAQPMRLHTHWAAHLWVRDEGSGMSPETVARVFEPFFTTKATGQGTGLGLAVVHGIVQAHGGTISVRSELGQGSSFHLWLPSPDASFDDVMAPADLPILGGAGEEVLVVDDDEVVRLTSQALLQRAGYRVTACASAAEAQRLVGEAPQRFDAIVTDFNMAGQSGLDLARQLLAVRPDLVVILSTGLVFEGLRERARQAGVCDVLQKENNFEELAAAVQAALARSGAAMGAAG